jgi:hypothetical protein
MSEKKGPGQSPYEHTPDWTKLVKTANSKAPSPNLRSEMDSQKDLEEQLALDLAVGRSDAFLGDVQPPIGAYPPHTTLR